MDNAIDLVIENLTLSGHNLFPNVVSRPTKEIFIKFSPYPDITDGQHHEFTFTFGQMQADMRDADFYFQKKSVSRWLVPGWLMSSLVGRSYCKCSFPSSVSR
jgi:hypothetical protein